MPRSIREPEQSPSTLRFGIALVPSHLMRARERLRDYLRLHCADEEIVNDVVLCLEEAATNVIRHSGSDREMRIELHFEGELLTVLVADHGNGFDIDAFDPRAAPDPLRRGGRGLYIIGQLMDELSLRLDGGLEVHMRKRGVPRRDMRTGAGARDEWLGAVEGDYGDTRRRAILDEIDESFAAMDWEYRYVHVNAMALRRAGLARQDILGRTPWELYPDFGGSPAERKFREAMELGKPSVLEALSPIDGDWYETRVYPTPGGICVYARVITERKRREQERADLAAEVRRRNRVLAGAKQILGAALRSVSEEELGRVCLSVAEEVTGSKFGFIGEVGPDGLYDIAISDPGWDACLMEDQSGHRRGPAQFALHGLYGEVVTSGESLFANTPSEHPASVGTPSGHPHLSAFLGVPLRADGRTSGIIAVGNREGGYTDEERLTLEELAESVTEAFVRKRSAQALLEHEARLRTLFESMQEVFLLFDLVPDEDGHVIDGRYRDCNPAAERFLGKTRAELIGHTTGEVLGGLPTQTATAALEHVSSTGEPVQFTEYSPRLDRWYTTSLFAPWPGQVAMILLDITQRRQAEEALRESEERFRLLHDTMLQGVVYQDAEGAIVSMNPAAERILGKRPEDLVGSSSTGEEHDTLREDGSSFPGFEHPAMVALRTGETVSDVLVQVYNPRESRYRSICIQAVPLFRPGEDQPFRVYTVFDDVTERKEAEHALIESERRLHTVLDNSRDGINMLDLATGRYVFLSPAQLELTGFTEEELRDITAEEAFERVHPDDREVSMAQQRRVAAGEDVDEPVEYRWKVKSGEYRWFSDRRKLVRDEHGVPLALVGISRDITEKKRAEEELREAARFGAALASIDALVHSSLDFETVMQTALREAAAVIGAETAGASMHDDEAQQFRVAYVHNYPADKLGILIPDSDDTHGVEAMRTGHTVAVDDAQSDPRVVRRLMDTWNIKSVICAPLTVRGRAIGVAYFNYHTVAHHFSAQEVEFITKLASSLSAALENARLFEAKQAAQRRVEEELARTKLLHDVAVAATTSVSLEEVTSRTLQAIFVGMDLKVGTVYSYDRDRNVLELLAWHGIDEMADRFRTVAVTDDSAALVARAVLTQSVVTTAEVPLSEDKRAVLEAAGVAQSTGIALPIEYGGAVVGSCSFIFARDQAFGPDEVDVFRSLALILGQAIENARLYEAQKAIAVTLQENLLRPLPEVPGVEVGIVSQAAHAPELVGGDFSDVFELTDGRVAVLIGDVAGKGIAAAGLTETARSTVRAYASIEPSPALVLQRTNEALLGYDPDAHHVTAFFVVLDPQTGHAQYASAGHPAAVHVRPFSSRPLDVTYGPPLHSFPTAYTSEYARLSLDDYLLLYTDGVTEARRGGEEFGEERLCALAARLRGRPPQEVAEGVRDAAREFAGQLRDDLHVVCLRLA